jgi:hypothetical protein
MASLFAAVLIGLGVCAAAVWVATAWLGETNLLVRLGVKSAADTPLPRVRADPPTSELLDNVGRV